MASSIRTSFLRPATNQSPTVSLRDAIIVAFLPIQFLISWCAPQRLWPLIGRLLQPLTAYLYAKGARHAEQVIAATAGRQLDAGLIRNIPRQLALEEFIMMLQILRDYRPGGWRPTITLIGRQYLDLALKEGNGAILWVTYTNGARLIAKMAIQRGGYLVSHLSRPRHGLSSTKFGIKFLNWIQTTIEKRYVAERIVVEDREFQKAVRSLIARLRANKVISITVHRYATRPSAVPFLDGQIVLADGACRLSYITGAALLPVVAYRDGHDALKVEIGAPINTRQATTETTSVVAAHREYVARLERFVLAYPDQWRGWFQLSERNKFQPAQ